jgi:hypothetical protein
MRFGPLVLNRRRTLRGVAALVVAFLLAGQAMAATGCCIFPVLADQGTQAPCPGHADSDTDSVPQIQHNCPAEEPTPKARAVELPGVHAVAAIVEVVFGFADRACYTVPAIVAVEIPPPPLYARLQRLRL